MVGVGSAAVAVSSFATRLARDCHQHCQCNGNRSEKARPPGCAPALTTQAIPVAIGTASICTLERRAQKLRSCMFPAGLRDCIIDSLLRLHRAWLQLLFWPRRRALLRKICRVVEQLVIVVAMVLQLAINGRTLWRRCLAR
jgi:hypothetical protein